MTPNPWVITKTSERNLDPRRLTWKDLAAVLASNIGHVAAALYQLERPAQGSQSSGHQGRQTSPSGPLGSSHDWIDERHADAAFSPTETSRDE